MSFASRLMVFIALSASPAYGQEIGSDTFNPTEAVDVILYEGLVDSASAERFVEAITQAQDTVIGLNVSVEPSGENDDRYYASLSDGRLVVTSGDPLNAPQEIVVNGDIGRSWDMWRVDGFYLIKFGGMHAAGAMSWGALPVDEASLRLNPNVRIVRRPF
jgi:hypothetical protein